MKFDSNSARKKSRQKAVSEVNKQTCKRRVITDFAFSGRPSARYWAKYLTVAEGKAKVPRMGTRLSAKVKRA